MNVREIQNELERLGLKGHETHAPSPSKPLSLIHTCRSKCTLFNVAPATNYQTDQTEIRKDPLRCDKCLIPRGKFTVDGSTDSFYSTDQIDTEHRLPFTSKHPKSSLQCSLRSWLKLIKKKGTLHPVSLALCTCQLVHDTALGFTCNTNSEMIPTRKEEALMHEEKDGKPIDSDSVLPTMLEEVMYGTTQQHGDMNTAEMLELKRVVEEIGSKIDQLENEYNLQYIATVLQRKKLNRSFNDGFKMRVKDTTLSDGFTFSTHEHEIPWLNRSPNAWPGILRGPTKEEFHNAVKKARIGVKQMCRALVQEKAGLDKVDVILKENQVSTRIGSVRALKYLLESLINQVFYEDFENIWFRKGGSSRSNCVLDPRQRPLAFYRTYMTLSEVRWEAMVMNCGEHSPSAYNQSFDDFCNEKMNKVAEDVLHWEIGEWPDELAKSFFGAAKWIWMLHLLAFSFQQPATIFRVGTETRFDPLYMEVLPCTSSQRAKCRLCHQHRNCAASEHYDSVKILAMIMPGFFLNNYEVIRCMVMVLPFSD